MIRWSIEDENGCEGFFESKFFRNDENGGEFSIYGAGQELKECAEKCVEAFNGLPEPTIDEICEKLAAAAREEGEEEGFELPALDGPARYFKTTAGSTRYTWTWQEKTTKPPTRSKAKATGGAPTASS